jgi:hypothetical protein
MADQDDETRQRIAIFEAAIAAYVLDSLDPHLDPELSHEAGCPHYLPHLTATDVLSYCQGLAVSMQSFWPTVDPKRLAEKMVLASHDPAERVS